jgi:hypothetical protein
VLSLRVNLGFVAPLALLLAGIDLRLEYVGVGWSDVADVTRAAIDVALAGGNPYGLGYAVSFPPGAPFVYGPLALLWYLPFDNPANVDLAISVGILAVLALRGRILGLALYATVPIFLQLASDGSNDTSVGLLLLIGLVLLERLPRAGGFVLGLAVAFKPYALAWAPPLLIWGGLGPAAAMVLGAALLWLPAILLWGLGPILASLRMATDIADLPYYSLGDALDRLRVRLTRDELDVVRIVAAGLATLGVVFNVRSHRGVVLGGAVIFVATMYTGFWSTFAYLGSLAPVICWYLDGWVGNHARIRWPLDPWGSLAYEADLRWPKVPDRPRFILRRPKRQSDENA